MSFYLLTNLRIYCIVFIFFLKNLSITSAIAPSPVTLHAVPKLSIVIYSAIISAWSLAPNPKIDPNMPNAAIMAPPGTPGAATIMMPSIQIKPANREKLCGIPSIIIIANEQAVILSALPDRWMVAHRGIVKRAIPSLTPFFMVDLSVTGMVAADEEVPSAV